MAKKKTNLYENYRKLLKMSYREFAELLGYSKSFIWDICNTKRTPSESTKKKIERKINKVINKPTAGFPSRGKQK